MASRYNNKNASSFNPFDASAGDQRSLDEIEKQRKRQKQNFYRDQLDQLVHTNQHKKAHDKATNDTNANYAQNSLDFTQGRRNQAPKFTQPQPSQPSQPSYSQEQQRRPNEYEQYQQQGGCEQKYGSQANDNAYEGHYGQQQDVRQPQGAYQELNPRSNKDQEEGSTFSQQDQLREQLLSKIKNGYKPQNEDVWNTYQRVHDSQQRNRQEAERNLVEKAAKEKLQREESQAMNQWDQKKKLQREMFLANQQQIQQKESQKKRDQQQEKDADKQRIQDSLFQFEQEKNSQREKNRRLVEENNRQIQQQRQEFTNRNQRRGNAEASADYNNTPAQDSIDQFSRERKQQDDYNIDQSRALASNTNQQYEPEQNYQYEKPYEKPYQQQYEQQYEQYEGQGQGQGQYEKPYQQQYEQKYEQPRQPSDYDYIAAMENLNMRDNNPRSDNPSVLQQQGGYAVSQQGYGAPEQRSREISEYERQQNLPSRQKSQGRSVASSRSDYQMIRDKLKGSGFNIITGDAR